MALRMALSNQAAATLSSRRALTKESLHGLGNCASATQAKRLLSKALLNDDSSALYGSIAIPAGASSKRISDGDLAIQVRMINKKYDIMDLIELSGDRDADRTSLALLCLTVASSLSAIAANQNLPGPEIIRFIVVWLFSFAPLAFVGYGIANVSELQALLVLMQRNIFPAYRSRMIQHEAGHFLMGHLLGYPVKGYSVNAVKNAVEFYPLADTDRGTDMAQRLGFDKPRRPAAINSDDDDKIYTQASDVPFFSDKGRGALFMDQSVLRDANNATKQALSPAYDPSSTWPFRGLDEATLDQLAVISVAGVCAEILAFGRAEGGIADLSQLRQLFASAQVEMSEREVTDRIRFALGYTMSQLRRHLGCLDALAEVMERDGSVEECVYAIETCDNVSGQSSLVGTDYEVQRRREFRAKQVGILETVLLGDKNIDSDEDRLVQGKGGGYKKQTVRLTGDDPLYAALAVATGFLLWASNGGLSLH
ncbi:hypothetical protein MPSEU_000163900 [Mayamaea pseudoterrestris]|nr:hypothetical protein MPSEU_000163900 [Mayamaea pseudoterrestris]